MNEPLRQLHDVGTVGQLYLDALCRYADRTALIAHDGTPISYAALESTARRLAHRFGRLGLQPQDVVAFLFSNRSEAVAVMIAAQLAGLQALSLHPLASDEDHRFVLSDSGARLVLVDADRYPDRLASFDRIGGGLTAMALYAPDQRSGLYDQLDELPTDDIRLNASCHDVTKISYTGGTTGRSKGVVQTHLTAITMASQMLAAYEWPDPPRYLASTPISHASGSLLLPVLLRGGTVFFLDKFSPETLLEKIAAHRINLMFLVPTQIYALLDCPALDQADLSSLALILYGASPITAVRLREALTRIGPVFGQLYGQAEAPMTLTYLSRDDHVSGGDERLHSCGRALPGNQIRLLDEALNEVPSGEIGEICVRSPLIMKGYLNRPEETAQAFRGGWLHTGDMARRDAEGYFYIVDRAKDMIITGGFNVFPSEVEACLARHPDVALCAVIGVPHEKWGEAVTAFVVPRPDTHPSAAELMAFVTRHKGVVHSPKLIVFESTIPLTAVGKIDRKALREHFWSDQDRRVG